jgi:hypothetical protein
MFAYVHTHISLQHNVAEFAELIESSCTKAWSNFVSKLINSIQLTQILFSLKSRNSTIKTCAHM